MQKNFFISKPFLYAPGLENESDWLSWAEGKKEILNEKTSPSLSYTDPLFRRRLSQLSKMTVDTVHQLVEFYPTATSFKTVFTSFRGEIEREFKISKSIVEDQMILPATFSLSVFNAPVALASMANKLTAGYNTVFAPKENFHDALLSAACSILAETQNEIIFVYGDELIPADYEKVAPENRPPLCFATVISCKEIENLNSKEYTLSEIPQNVYDFIQLHIKKCYN
ncbi:MAG: beta-ketoacyl synthase chain length factor [Treponema sp.]|nr:beta-ketoacyl synthase chain length factor [Candidatus Treponema scatequi]